MPQSVIFSSLYMLLAVGAIILSANAANSQNEFGFCETPSVEEFDAKAPPSLAQSRISSIAQNTFRLLSNAPRVRNTAFSEAQERENRGGLSITFGDLLTSVGEGAAVYNESQPRPSTPSQSSGGTGDCVCESGDLSDCSYELSGRQEQICY